MFSFSNKAISKLLREIAAAYTVTGASLFQIRAYQTAADAIEHATSEVKDLWEQGQLNNLSGLGPTLKQHLDELFTNGSVKNWDKLKSEFPAAFFEFLDIPGVGPKTSAKLVNLKVNNLDQLKQGLESGELAKKGLTSKTVNSLLESIKGMSSASTERMLLPYALAYAKKILEYLSKSNDIEQSDVLGSLRRMVATIGDLDFAVASYNPKKAIDHLLKMPGIKQVVEKGDDKVVLTLDSGLHLDFLICHPATYGALLQHFTGSKHHNIHLRKVAEKQGLSLSEHGIKNLQTGKIQNIKTEEEFYKTLGMQLPPPEVREDQGEIELALKHQLPKLIELKDIKGDFHLHSSYPIEPSHDLGQNSVKEIAKVGKRLGYAYLGISDHQPSQSNHTAEQVLDILEKRSKYIDQINYSGKNFRVLKLLEVDISGDGSLGIPEKGLDFLDFAIVGIHSGHRHDKDKITQRILKALQNPKAKILAHPTGRLLNQRDAYDANWETIFKFAALNHKALEINAFPNRLDLPDDLVKMAKGLGVKFTIDTDAHEISQMENMEFGVSVARRGWLQKGDVINSWDLVDVKNWFGI